MKKQTLRYQFRLWTVLLVVVPSVLIMSIYTVNQIKLAKQQNLELISQRVYFQERLINYWIAERAAEIRKISQLAAFRGLDDQQMKLTLAEMQNGDNNFDSLSYIDKDGIFRVSTLSTGIKYPSVIDKPYYQAALAGKDHISDVVTGRNSGLPIINFSFPIYDYTGDFQGLILGSVRITTLNTLLRDNIIGQTGEIILVDREGTLLTEPRFLNVSADKGLIEDAARMNLKMSDGAFRTIRLGETGSAAWVDYQGKRVLGAYRYIPEQGWTLIGKINQEEVLAPIYRQLAMMASGTIFLVLLILPLASLLTNRIKQPIEWLIGQSKLITAKNYEMAGREKYSEKIPRELGTLCETFVKMSHKIENTVGLLKENEAKLESKVVEIQDINAVLEEEINERQAAEEALRQLNAELEHKVDQRTVALSAINAALEKEIAEHHDTIKALNDKQNALVISEEQLKNYANELAATNMKLIALNDELRRTSLLDGLTGIANRRYFNEFLEREWQRAKREKQPLALLMLDIDFFKAYNDTYGHLAGDDCLKLIASMLADMPKRATDIVARYGGEEFAVVLPDTDDQGAAVVGENVRSGVEKLGIEHTGSLISNNVTVSVGVAVVVPEQNSITSTLIAAADHALYQAKEEGRNRVKIAANISRE